MAQPGGVREISRTIVYGRDEGGLVLATEVVAAEAWSDALLDGPPADADVRVVLLASGRGPDHLPPWLAVELISPTAGESGPASGLYARQIADRDVEVALRLGLRLIRASARPEQHATVGDFLSAGAVAARHPAPAPADQARRLRVLGAFCRGRSGVLGTIAERSGIALEWWLARQFGTPDVLAEEVLLERVREGAPELAAALREVRAAAVPAGSRAHAELALDRQALLAQATPWHYVEGGDVRPALGGLRRWLQRFAVAYEAHALAVRARAAVLRAELERELPRVRALERLDSIRALGRPVGTTAAVELRAVLDELVAFEPTPASAPLEVEPALFARASAATEGVRAALERQRARLAAATVRVVLDRPDVDRVDRLLQAIQATDLDGIERAMDFRFAAHIEEVLGGLPPRSPFEALAARYPEVRADDVDDVAAELRALLISALEEGRGNTVVLA